MSLRLIEKEGTRFVETHPGHRFITAEADAVDLVGLCGEHESNLLLFYGDNLDPAFFDLSTGLAGAVLQKFATYQMRAALVLPPDFPSRLRFDEMARELNRGRHFGVFSDRGAAKEWLLSP